jgi:hypothetical protein
MKSLGKVLLGFLMAALLSGCVVVPLGGWHGHRHGDGGYHHYHGSRPYRGR